MLTRGGGAPMSSRLALASFPPSVAAPRHAHTRRLYPRPTCASRSSCSVARVAAAHDLQKPRLVAVQSPPQLSAGAVRRDAATGLSILLAVLAVLLRTSTKSATGLRQAVLCRNSVMAFSLSLIILSFSASRAMQKLEILANKLTNIVAEEVSGTLSSLKLSFLEISDLTSQLKNIRKRLTSFRASRK